MLLIYVKFVCGQLKQWGCPLSTGIYFEGILLILRQQGHLVDIGSFPF